MAMDRRSTDRGDRRSGVPQYAVLLIDIDYFKRINDTYGHDAGDVVLCEVSRVMAETCRATDVLVRWGGEEFLVICPNTSQEDALAFADRIRVSIELGCIGSEAGMPWNLTASVGVSQPSSLEESYEVVIRRADAALYAAKNQGRNRVVQLGSDAAA